jgi:hypothetical protein
VSSRPTTWALPAEPVSFARSRSGRRRTGAANASMAEMLGGDHGHSTDRCPSSRLGPRSRRGVIQCQYTAGLSTLAVRGYSSFRADRWCRAEGSRDLILALNEEAAGRRSIALLITIHPSGGSGVWS